MTDDRIAALEAHVQRLEDRILWMERALGIDAEAVGNIPVEFMLTGKEARLLGYLYAREGGGTKEAIMCALYNPGVDDEVEIKIVDVFVCKIRKKLAPFGIAIDTQWGRGYSLSPSARAQIKAMMPGQAVPA